MARFYPLQVQELRRDTREAVVLTLEPRDEDRDAFAFIQGQYLTFRRDFDGEELRRSYSICAGLDDGVLRVGIKRVDGGCFSCWANESLQEGDVLEAVPPMGAFHSPIEPDADNYYLGFAGGSGITPFRSFIQQLAADAPDRDVHLLYYNEAMTPLFANEWQQLERQLPGLKISQIDTSQQGMITRQQLLTHCPDAADRTAWLCGPYGLIETSRSLLLDLGVTEQDIHHELFGPRTIDPSTIKQAGSVYFSRSGVRVATTKQSTTPLLTLAEQARLNPISGCRMGVCHQCTCRKQHGLVYNTLTGQTSDTGGEDIQLCVSLPVGDVQLDL